MRRWSVVVLSSSIVLLGLGLAYYQEITWSWQYLKHESQRPDYSSEPIPTCLGCNLLFVSLPDWDGQLDSSLAKLESRTFSFDRAYTNSSDPFKAESSLFYSIYPQHQNSSLPRDRSLFEILKNRGYTIIDQATTLPSAPFAGHLTFLNSQEFGLFLKNQNLLKNTLLVFFAFSGKPDDRLHVPLALYHPEVKQGRSIPNLISFVDLAPILLNLIGSPAPNTAEGRNLFSPDPDRPVYGLERDLDFTFDGQWKLVKNKDQSESLFYLPLDPLQKQNLVNLQTPWTRTAYQRLKQKTAQLETMTGAP